MFRHPKIKDRFYTLSPNLVIAIAKAFEMQDPQLLKNHAYYEFGIYKGFCLWFAEQFSKDVTENFMYYGFDSFEGLPEPQVDANKYWYKGRHKVSLDFVKTKLQTYGANFNRIKLYKGFFSKQLFDDLKKDTKFLPVSICVIDSDLYESCLEALKFINDYLVDGSIILFDEYNAFDADDNHGERKALKEFECNNPEFKKEFLFNFGACGVAYKINI